VTSVDTIEIARLRATAGATVDPSNLPPRARRAVAVASAVGAPVAPALDAVRAAMVDDNEHRRAVRVASAQGKAIGIGLVAAPFVLVPVLGAAAGIDVAAFYRSGLGVAVALVAAALLAVGGTLVIALVHQSGRDPVRRRRPRGRELVGPVMAAVVAAVLVHPVLGIVVGAVAMRARPDGTARGEVEEAAELMAIASAGGVGFGHMLRVAADELPTLADDLRRAALAVEIADDVDVPPDLDGLVTVMRVARDLGAPVAGTLRSFAAEARAERQAMALEAASRLPAQLTVPTVLFLLPATLLLVGAPLVAGALASLPT